MSIDHLDTAGSIAVLAVFLIVALIYVAGFISVVRMCCAAKSEES